MEDLPKEESKGEQDHRSFIATTKYSSFTITNHKVECSRVSMVEFTEPKGRISLIRRKWVDDSFPSDVEELLMSEDDCKR